jgi:hypothetical protein
MITIENDRVITSEPKARKEMKPAAPSVRPVVQAATAGEASRSELLQNWYAQYYQPAPLAHANQYNVQHYQSLFGAQIKQESEQPSYAYYDQVGVRGDVQHHGYPNAHFYRAHNEHPEYNAPFVSHVPHYEPCGPVFDPYQSLRKRSAAHEMDQAEPPSKRTTGYVSPTRYGHSYAFIPKLGSPPLYDNPEANNTSDSDDGYNLNALNANSANSSSNASSSSFALSTTSSL